MYLIIRNNSLKKVKPPKEEKWDFMNDASILIVPVLGYIRKWVIVSMILRILLVVPGSGSWTAQFVDKFLDTSNS